LDGKPTERNPNFGDTVSTPSGHKTEHLPEAICEFNVLEPSSVASYVVYMESYKNSLHVFVDVIHKKFVSIHLIYGDYLNNH
jgi:hypothetical protein